MSEDTKEETKIVFKDPVRQVLNENEIMDALRDAYKLKGYHVCRGQLDNWQDLGEKTATIIICGGNIGCSCKALQAASEDATRRLEAATSRKPALDHDPEDALFEE